MMRVDEGEESMRAAVLQNTLTIAVADFGFSSQGDLGGWWVEKSK